MPRTLYYALEFVTLHQKNPGYEIINDNGNPRLDIAGHEVSWRKWRLTDGRGDPGEDPNRDWWDYEEWAIAAATFRRPDDYNTAQRTYATETGTHTYRVWHATSVPDDFLIPAEFVGASIGPMAAAVLDDFRSALMDYAEQRGLPLVDVANLLEGGSALYDALSEHIETQFDLIDRALSGDITAQAFDRLSDRATKTLLIDLLEAGGLPATLARAARNMVVLGINAADPNDTIIEVGIHGVGFVSSDPTAAYTDAFLLGSVGADYLDDPDLGPVAAGAGNDYVAGTLRTENLLSGGSGADTIAYIREDAIYIDLSRGWAKGATAEDTIVGFENALGGGGDDALLGADGGNWLQGRGGDDYLASLGGDDVLDGGLGADRLFGGTGTDTANYESTGWRGRFFGVTVDLTLVEQIDRNDGFTAEGGDELLDIENLKGGLGADRFFGNSAGNTLWGAEGGDSLFGRDGRDVLYGNSGADRLFGGYGGDVLRAGLGKDHLYGGLGPDVFVFGSLAEAGLGRARDVVEDFQRGVDRIDLRLIDANTVAPGNQRFKFVDREAFSERAGELRFGNSLVAGDVDGDGRADFQIELSGLRTIGGIDFVL